MRAKIWSTVSLVFLLSCQCCGAPALVDTLVNPRSWKALGAAQQAFDKVKNSRAIASLPSHISDAKAALVVQKERHFPPAEPSQKENGLSNPGTSVHTKSSTSAVSNDQRTSSKQRADVYGACEPIDNRPSHAKWLPPGGRGQRRTETPGWNQYTLEQLSLPVLGLCLVSCIIGWILRDRSVSTDRSELLILEEAVRSLEAELEHRKKADVQKAAVGPCEVESGEDAVLIQRKAATSAAQQTGNDEQGKAGTDHRRQVEGGTPLTLSGETAAKDKQAEMSQHSEHSAFSCQAPELANAVGQMQSQGFAGTQAEQAETELATRNAALGGLKRSDAASSCLFSGSSVDTKHPGSRIEPASSQSAASKNQARIIVETASVPRAAEVTCLAPDQTSAESMMEADKEGKTKDQVKAFISGGVDSRQAGLSSGLANPTSAGQIVSKKANKVAVKGWLDKAQSTSPLPPTVGLGGMMDLVAVMKHLAQQSGQHPDLMDADQRMQLQQMALQYCQQQQNNWLHAQANSIRSDTLSHKQQEAGKREAVAQADRMRILLQDGLTSGLWITLAMSLFCGVKFGYLGHQLGRCPTFNSLPAFGFWRPWVILEAGKMVLCYVDFTRMALLGCAIMLGTAYAAIKAGAFKSSAHDSPMLKIFIALGLICGFAGYHAVGNLGGNAVRWLMCWETWVGMHMVAAWQLPQLHSRLAQGNSASIKRGLWQISISLLFPLAMGVVPFPGGLKYFQGLLVGLLL